jgi:hypothetical protein
MSKFIEVTYINEDKSYKGMINTSWVFDIVPTTEHGAKTKIRFAPTNDYERRYLHTVYACEKYEDIKKLL